MFPLARRRESGVRVVFLAGTPGWDAMFGGEGGDTRPSNEDKLCGRKDRAQSDVVLRSVGGGDEGSRSLV